MNKKLKYTLTVISITLIIASILCALFPTISNTITQIKINEKIDQFTNRVENIVDLGDTTYEEAKAQGKADEQGYLLDEETQERISSTPVIFKADIDRLRKDSETYNKSLKKNQRDLLTKDSSYTGAALNLASYGIYDGIYGYVTAPSIGLKLPIYLGSNDYNMSIGAAHLCYTSLPIGGKDTNCVLSGHTGYIGRTFFDNLPSLKIGNKVSVTNYWNTLNYKVIRTFTCKPNDVKDIFIESEKDLLSLFTCIGDGYGGFERFYVICERI